MKDISELLVEDNAWMMIQDWIGDSQANIRILENTEVEGKEALFHLQITNKSTMGAIALECGGFLIDHGWLYILGSGHPEIFGSLINNTHQSLFEEGFVVAYDVVGGIFAMNTGKFDNNNRNIYYFAPDTLEWEDTGKGYTDFIYWVLQGDLNKYYESFRWSNWIEDVSVLTRDQGISIYPYLWTKQGEDVENSYKKAISIKELWAIQSHFRNA
ncbi:DUF2625 domain-containing protein [Paenibacillus sp. SC116]|uniref:DUF2625 domain-containing protein n=1 Tax=Paenibacillus sp. SC116 TaxID=2968986 RepID=UPI00215A399D|nr:DUF2625 domain-containing protein [Paenibacillus sp. SC116]MCR8845642.1 DUF2625 domain-containing protein [Paenibacillus sp. SC116]